MADFTPINTQEEFDRAIQERLGRQRAQIEEQFKDYDQIKADRDKYAEQITGFETTAKENAGKITELEAKLEEANKKVGEYEMENLRTQVALDKGLPMELRGRLNGSTKEELEKDADSLKKIFGDKNRENLPGFEQLDPGDATGRKKEKEEMRKLIKKIRKGE